MVCHSIGDKWGTESTIRDGLKSIRGLEVIPNPLFYLYVFLDETTIGSLSFQLTYHISIPKGYAIQQIIDLALNLQALIALHLPIPDIRRFPCADHQSLLRIFKISNRLSDNISGLLVGKCLNLPEKRYHFHCPLWSDLLDRPHATCRRTGLGSHQQDPPIHVFT